MASNFFKIDRGVTLAPQSAVASPQNGDVYYDSTRNTYVFRNNGASIDLQSRSDVATASSLTSANFTSSVTQSSLIKLTGSTASNIHGLTASSDGKMVVLYNASSAIITIKNASVSEATASNRILTSTGADVIVGASQAIQLTYDSAQARWIVVSAPSSGSSGGTGKNYLTTYKNNPGNGDLESGSTTGWSLGTTGTLTNGLPTGTPTFGSGASGNLSISAVSSGQLAGSYSLSYASSAATTQGNMLASDAFTIDLEDQAKVLTWKFYYKAQTNPGNANWSGTSSNSFGVAIWDVTNSAWLPTTASFGMTQSSGVGIVSGTVQTASNAAQLRLVVYNVNATSGAITLYFDDFSVSPQTAPIGAIVTDWVAYTPTFTGFGSPTGVSFFSRRVGDSLEVKGSFTSGVATATPNAISIGFNGVSGNVVIDTTRVPPSQLVGSAGQSFASTTYFDLGVLAANVSSTTVSLSIQSSTTNLLAGSVNGSVISASGRIHEMYFTVPISGWSSNVQMSSDTDTRVVAASVQLSNDQVISFNTNTKVGLNSIIFDTHTAFDTSNNRYVAPISGKYKFSGHGIWAAVTSYAESRIMFFVNGVQYNFKYNASKSNNAVALGHGFDFSSELDLRAGDYVELYVWHAREGNGTWTLLGNASLTKCLILNVERISGPATIAASESVNARYTNSSGQTIANATITQINSWTRDFDSHNAFASNAYVVPVSGKYQVNIKLLFAGTSMSTGGVHPTAYIYVNGTAVSSGEGTAVTNASEQAGVNMSDIINVNAGDSITVRLQHSNGGNRALITIGTANTFSISRVGN